VSLPWGLWDSRRSLRHVRNTAQASRGKRVSNLPIGAAIFPLGRWRFASKAGTYPSLVEQDLIPIERRESNRMSAGKFARYLWHVHSVVDQSVRNCASVSRGKHVSHFPIGAMGSFEHEHAHLQQLCWSRSGSSRLTLSLHRQQHRRPANNEQNVSLPSGRCGNFSRSPWHTPTEHVVDRSVCSCASVSRGKHVSNFPIGAMGNIEGLWQSLRHIQPVVDRSVGRSCVQA